MRKTLFWWGCGPPLSSHFYFPQAQQTQKPPPVPGNASNWHGRFTGKADVPAKQAPRFFLPARGKWPFTGLPPGMRGAVLPPCWMCLACGGEKHKASIYNPQRGVDLSIKCPWVYAAYQG